MICVCMSPALSGTKQSVILPQLYIMVETHLFLVIVRDATPGPVQVCNCWPLSAPTTSVSGMILKPTCTCKCHHSTNRISLSSMKCLIVNVLSTPVTSVGCVKHK